MTELLRLDKALSNMGIASRKEIKAYVKQGRIIINGEKATSSDCKISSMDVITLDGQNVSYQAFEYYMLNKPAGVISATKDSAKTVIDLIPSGRKDLFPVGRLDKDTVGLLIITNDGALAHRLLSPNHHIPKTYYAKCEGSITEEDINRITQGLQTATEQFKPADITVHNNREGFEATITIYEGKYHEVKRIFQAVGARVIYLKRLSMGSLHLDESLPEGSYRPLTQSEIEILKQE